MLLNLVLFAPLVGFFLLLFMPKEQTDLIKKAGLVIALLVFIGSLMLIPQTIHAGNEFQFEINAPWITYPAINYHVGIDGISIWLILLSTFLTPIAMLISWNSVQERPKQFWAFLLLLEFGLIGVFLALYLFLFYVFCEI